MFAVINKWLFTIHYHTGKSLLLWVFFEESTLFLTSHMHCFPPWPLSSCGVCMGETGSRRLFLSSALLSCSLPNMTVRELIFTLNIAFFLNLFLNTSVVWLLLD